jgi:hypothetical protein
MTPEEKIQALARLVEQLEVRCRRQGRRLLLAVVGLLALLLVVLGWGRAVGVPLSAASLRAGRIAVHEVVFVDDKGQAVATLNARPFGLTLYDRHYDGRSPEPTSAVKRHIDVAVNEGDAPGVRLVLFPESGAAVVERSFRVDGTWSGGHRE